MNTLSDISLINAYLEANKLNLSPEFIKIIKIELDSRGISIEYQGVKN